MNFAPTIDVYSNPLASVVGPRAFSSDPVQTGLLAVAFYQGLSSQGVIATAKHFPGHGSADGDSHGSLPVVTADLATLWDRDLVPYRFLIREGLPAVMNAHVAYPAILSDLTPASLSPFFQSEVLRGQLGFKGVVITDDLEMWGASGELHDPTWAALAAVRAGNDILLISHTAGVQEQTWDALRREMSSDPEFRLHVHRAARRILRMKLEQLRQPGAVPLFPDPSRVANQVPAPGASEFFFDSAARGVTLLKNKRIPLLAEPGQRIALVGQIPEFFQAGRERFPDAKIVEFPYVPFFSASQATLQRIPEEAARYDLIIYCLANYSSEAVLQELESLGDKVVVISALTPVYLLSTPWVESAVAVYGWNLDSFRAGFAAVAGDYQPGGRLPVLFSDG